MRRNEQLEEGGVEFVLNCDVGATSPSRRSAPSMTRADRDRRLQVRDLPAPGVGAQGIVRRSTT
jgi:glutamate synthase (NADPH/NADH) small chain